MRIRDIHGFVYDWHVPACERDKLCVDGFVEGVEGGAFEGGGHFVKSLVGQRRAWSVWTRADFKGPIPFSSCPSA